jgi:hypothetical protein
MSKYNALSDYLRSRREPFWRATFDDLEQVLGFSLPKGAVEKSGWWENNVGKGQARAWLDAGWRVESVDRRRNSISRQPSPSRWCRSRRATR